MADGTFAVPSTGGKEWDSANKQLEKLFQNVNSFLNQHKKMLSIMDSVIKGYAEVTKTAQEAVQAQKKSNEAIQLTTQAQAKLTESMKQGAEQVDRFSRMVNSIKDFKTEQKTTIVSTGIKIGFPYSDTGINGGTVTTGTSSTVGTPATSAPPKPSILTNLINLFKNIKTNSGVFLQSQSLGEKMIRNAATEEDKQEWKGIGTKANQSLGMAGEGAMQSLRPVLDMLSTALDSGQFDKILGMLGGGFMLVAEAIGWIVTGLLNLSSLIQQNWDLIAPILEAIALRYLYGITIQLYTMAAAWLRTWLTASLPIMLVVAAIALVIIILQQLGVSSATIVGFIMGVIFALVATIMNYVAVVWNFFAMLADFLVNLFIDPIYAVKKLLYDFIQEFYAVLYSIFNGIEGFLGEFMLVVNKGINFVLEAINKVLPAFNNIFGTNYEPIKLLDENNFHAVSDKILDVMNSIPEPTSDKAVFASKRLNYQNAVEANKTGSALGANLANNISNYTKGFSAKGLNSNGGTSGTAENAISPTKLPTTSPSIGLNTISNVGHVGSVGKVEDKVDISSEDLKMMRELAELNAIQNFVTLTPTVQVTTGDINSGADLNTIMTRISTVLQEELVSTAEGVYT
jgi:hypothetical protein